MASKSLKSLTRIAFGLALAPTLCLTQPTQAQSYDGYDFYSTMGTIDQQLNQWQNEANQVDAYIMQLNYLCGQGDLSACSKLNSNPVPSYYRDTMNRMGESLQRTACMPYCN